MSARRECGYQAWSCKKRPRSSSWLEIEMFSLCDHVTSREGGGGGGRRGGGGGEGGGGGGEGGRQQEGV